MRHKVRDVGVFFCLAVMLFTVTSCGKEVSDRRSQRPNRVLKKDVMQKQSWGQKRWKLFRRRKPDGSACRHCGGAGKIVCELCGGSHGKPCSICHGKGVITDDCILCHGAKKCTVCGGSGKV